MAKILLGSVEPWMMAGLLYLGAGLGLVAIHVSRAVMSLTAAEAPLRQSDVPWLSLVIMSGDVAGPLLLLFGLVRMDQRRRWRLSLPNNRLSMRFITHGSTCRCSA